MAYSVNLQHQLGAGFNFAFEPNPSGPPGLSLPDDVVFVEAGLAELQRMTPGSAVEHRHLSLHLARTPIVEAPGSQAHFLSYMASALAALRPAVRRQLVSVGVHLTGSRQQGNGLLGGADTYHPCDEHLQRAQAFIEGLRRCCDLPVWIENANFYSSSPHQVLETWRQTGELCRRTGCGAIVDLAHIHVEANNSGLAPATLLGAVPWGNVVEFHLSGITTGQDGSMHDGHSHPVHDGVWALLSQALPLLPGGSEGTLFTIEHTPPVWRERAEAFETDFSRLRQMLAQAPAPVSFAATGERYMVGYLRYWINGQIPLLAAACEQRGVVLDDLLNDWLCQLQATQCRVVFDHSEVPPEERPRSVELVPGFLAYAKTELRKAQGAGSS